MATMNHFSRRHLIHWLALAACAIVGARSAVAQRPGHDAPPRHGAFPNVSPDGRYVLFMRDSGGQPMPYVMNADGSNERPVPGRFFPMSWFPDSKRLFVGIPGPARGAPMRLASVSLDGTDLKEISTGDVKVVGGARLLGDGNTILFGAPTRDSAGRPSFALDLMTIDGSHVRPVPMPALAGRLVGMAAPSRDGRQLAFVVADTSDPTSYARSTTLYVMNIDGNNVREIATLPNLIEQPAWSHDGRMIAVQHSGRTPHLGTPVPPDHVPDANLVVIEVETGLIRPITHRNRQYLDEVPSWSPNGYIYFQSTRDGPMEIYRMKADGSEQVRITGARRGD
jgi:Tol biopolymer transport system component